MERDTERYPLFIKQQILALKYWIRLISMLKNCYLIENRVQLAGVSRFYR